MPVERLHSISYFLQTSPQFLLTPNPVNPVNYVSKTTAITSTRLGGNIEDAWEKKNAELRSMGLPTVLMPIDAE